MHGVVIRIVKLKEEELEQISGGSTPYIWIGIAIVTAIIFLSGVIDGLTNPKECGS